MYSHSKQFLFCSLLLAICTSIFVVTASFQIQHIYLQYDLELPPITEVVISYGYQTTVILLALLAFLCQLWPIRWFGRNFPAVQLMRVVSLLQICEAAGLLMPFLGECDSLS